MKVKTSELIATHERRLSKNEFRKLKASVEREGIREPIEYVVFQDEKYVVNGHHRLLAARLLGIEELMAKEVELPYRGYRTDADLINTDLR